MIRSRFNRVYASAGFAFQRTNMADYKSAESAENICAIMPTNMKPVLLFALNNNNNTNDDRSAAVGRSTSG
jgi:hypothetical protein